MKDQEPWSEAVQIYRRLSQQDPLRYRPQLAQALTNLGAQRADEKKPDQAESLLREALGLREKLVAEQPGVYETLLAATLVSLGRVLRDIGREDEARDCYQRAALLDPANRQGARWRAWSGLARLERGQGALEVAYGRFVQAVQDLSAQRGELGAAADRRIFGRDLVRIYRELVDLCLQLAEAEEHRRAHWQTQAWYWAEHGKGRTLLELLGRTRPAREQVARHPVYTRWHAQEQRVQALEAAQQRLAQEKSFAVQDAARAAIPQAAGISQEMLEQAQAELKRLRREVARAMETGPTLPQVALPTPARLACFLRGLAQGRGLGYRATARPLLVDYFMLGGGRYVVFLLPLWRVRPGQPLPLEARLIARPQADADRIVDYLMAGLAVLYKLAAAQRQTRSPPLSYKSIQTASDLERLAEHGLDRLAELPQLIGATYLQPWADTLQELQPTELILVPNTGLHLYPLHAALLADGTPLIEQYPLVYLPNAALARPLAWRRKYSPRPTGRIILGPAGTDLPHSTEETKDLAARWGLHEGDGLYSLERMKIERLREQAGRLAVAHLSTHSAFDHEDYLQTGILFHEERLTLLRLLSDPGFDFSGMRLVYLNSCESGMVQPDVSDEIGGLVWTLLQTGAEAVMATLWSVEDGAARDMSYFFYKHWKPDVPLSIAYQQAVREMRGKYSHPVHWAPFVLHGNGF